jgi:hypothetical protein
MSTRTDSHTISVAENIYTGDAYHAGAQGGGRGLPLLQLVEADLGTPIVGDVDGLVTAAGTGGTAAVGTVGMDGALATSTTLTTLDVPRTLVVDSTGAGDTSQVLTITGTDVYGAPMVETIAANGTTAVPGLKAFKTITNISNSVEFAGNLTIGTTDALGLPFAIADAGDMYIGNEDNVNAVPAAGTLVVAVTTNPATAITGDVRGTYNPDATLDGSVPVKLIYLPAGRKTITAYGVVQFSG